jgi:hypothetical protein
MWYRSCVLLAVFGVVLPFSMGCVEQKENKNNTAGNDYSTCDPVPINNQIVICDDFKLAVEELCGFNLTVEPCGCVTAIEGCTGDQAWLATILDCRTSATDCPSYINCVGAVGESPSGCTAPVQWDCLITSTPS